MVLTASAGDGQTPPELYDAREHYTNYEYRIPMRDGGEALDIGASRRTEEP